MKDTEFKVISTLTQAFPHIGVIMRANLGENSIPNLTSQDFSLKESGASLPVTVIPGIRIPTSLVLLLDESWGMEPWIREIQENVGRLIDGGGPSVRMSIYAYSTHTRILAAMQDLADPKGKHLLSESLRQYGRQNEGSELFASVRTAIRDALASELGRRKVIVCITSGISQQSPDAAIADVKRFQVAVYTIGLGRSENQMDNLKHLISHSGGKFFGMAPMPGKGSPTADPPDQASFQRLRMAIQAVTAELAGQYLLEFSSREAQGPGSATSVEITLPKLALSHTETLKIPEFWKSQ